MWTGEIAASTAGVRFVRRYAPRRRAPGSVIGAALLLLLAACSQFGRTREPAAQMDVSRTQLSIGYSQLYQEAHAIPKLKWLLMFKDKHEQMGEVTSELLSYYDELAATLERLAREFPAVRIDVQPMPEIEAEERKAIGADLAKDFAPVAGKTGADFEREALLMFYNTLNEQRHLVEVMRKRETDPALEKFLTATLARLDAHYAKVGALLNRRYFVH